MRAGQPFSMRYLLVEVCGVYGISDPELLHEQLHRA